MDGLLSEQNSKLSFYFLFSLFPLWGDFYYMGYVGVGNLDADSPHLMLVYIEDLQDGWITFRTKL
jgi:uncharacterized BrkB/YihY/UPF0761 family membrane protein